jgi:hypothetical protein
LKEELSLKPSSVVENTLDECAKKVTNRLNVADIE